MPEHDTPSERHDGAEAAVEVGRLVSQSAHEIHDSLTTMLELCERLVRNTPADAPHREDVDELRDAAGEGRALTEALFGHLPARPVAGRNERASGDSAADLLELQRHVGKFVHDINNTLTILVGSSALLLDEFEAASPYRDEVAQLHRAAQGALALTQKLRAQSRGTAEFGRTAAS